MDMFDKYSEGIEASPSTQDVSESVEEQLVFIDEVMDTIKELEQLIEEMSGSAD